MNGTSWRALLISLIPWFLACSENVPGDSARENTPLADETLLKGHAIYGHEVRSIRSCNQDEAFWAIDSTQLLWELHGDLAPGVESYEEVFVVVKGSEAAAPSDGLGADFPGSFVVRQVLYAAGEGFTCDLDLSGFSFRLSGNEPFWNLNVTGSTGEFRRMGEPDIIWTGIRQGSTEAGFSFFGESGEAGVLEVSLYEEPCRDSMSGAYFGYSASVTLDGEELTGCALRGEGQ